MCTPYAPYTHPLCALPAPLTCLMHTSYVPCTPYAHPLRALCVPLTHLTHLTCLTRTPYVPYMHPLHTLRTPLTCLTCTPYVPYEHPVHALRAPLMCLTCTPYVPYTPYMQDSDWLMSPLHPIRSMELNNLTNIKSWFFPHHLFEKSTCSQNRSISWL